MTPTKTSERNDTEIYQILNDLYQSIDDNFVSYLVSLAAPMVWRPHLEKYESDYEKILVKEGYTPSEKEKRIAEQNHMFSDGEFTIQTQTKRLRTILKPGRFENTQARNAIKIVYDDWESFFRPKLEELLGMKIQGDIWGDLRYIRQSLAHRRSIGVDELVKAKLIKNFLPDEEIIFTRAIIEKIRQELEYWYTEFLMKNFPSPFCRKTEFN